MTEEIVKKIIKNGLKFNGPTHFEELLNSCVFSISNGFIWRKTPEGYEFWFNIAKSYNRFEVLFNVRNYYFYKVLSDSHFINLEFLRH